ncbi:Asp23/Gls24 family envelope stress response protein [Micromonospora chersina]|uniref:Asp23/Gls24 family envelope stress response protein n=1 Tax=Micromonospora chersina TaxID=47854 RepID=UPI0033DFC158
MTGILPRRATAPPAPATDGRGAPAPAHDRFAAPAPAPDGSGAPSVGLVQGRTAWSEERIAGLAEEAAWRTGAVSEPVATVRLDGGAVRVDLDLVVAHGVELTAMAGAVRRRVAARIEACTGLTVEAVTVTVVGLRLPAETTSPAGGDHPGTRRHDPARAPGPGTDAREAT